MNLDQPTIEQATKFILPYVNELFKNTISPLLKSKWSDFLNQRGIKKSVEKKAERYISSVFVDCAYINTIAFQNFPKKLKDLYIPLTLKSETDEKEFIIEDKLEITNSYRRVLITDNAGMGKSTVVKKIIVEAILSKNYIPFYLELRSYTESTDIENLLNDTIGLPKETGLSLISHMPYIVILDGFDEVALDLRKKAIGNILKFSKKYSNIPIIITSRPDNYLANCKGFNIFKIKPLKSKEAFALLKKFDDSDVISRKLIDSLKKDARSSLSGFLTTPLYVSLLYCAYRHKPVIPRRRHLFYSQVFDALFESHDLTKEPGYIREKYCGLDSCDFHLVLRRFAFWCLTNEMKIEFLKDHLVATLSNIEKTCPGVSFNPEDFVNTGTLFHC